MMHANPTPADGNEQLPRHTTPTWEMELLISGAAVFAMLQLPGWLGAHLLPLIPRFTKSFGELLTLGYVYLIGASLVLGVTFALHLILRAHWIAMIGVRSVFPEGVLWHRLRIGTMERELSMRSGRTADTSIERADNRATLVFAFGVMLALTLLACSMLVLLNLLITWGLGWAGFHPTHSSYLLMVLVLLWLVPLLLVRILDRKFGHHLPSNSKTRRLLAWVLRMYARTGFLGGFSLARVLESRAGPRRFMWLTIAIIFPVILAVTIGINLWQSSAHIGDYGPFPQFTSENADTLNAAHYDGQRAAVHHPAVAHIQSQVITDPYVRLRVPYLPQRDNFALQHDCSGLPAAHGADAKARVTLACLSTWHAVALDGKPLESLHYIVSSDTATGRPALQAMIDVRALAPGRHTLRVARTPPPPGSRPDKSRVWVIPFWR